ncbi:uncharacterized protein MELLADRAFT_86955 [Melampsora larici-populina 98AG31]|uniref:Uncharacterized protein n=1 Tax=Melampsora larici-populina (strain 98AG31 / pathotype 3-4-7) TaxID=747676 RepID=F4R3Z6_MELLP|nr:uncharacterized protein MELLADRAFT_86955 [Melampsora larici-populina 98AG31]EGG13077.1 hypothetical protein MELLADRAFT_86955 [Melampsora larici-populina 98AG31]
MPPNTGNSIKQNDKQASPGPDGLEAYQEYIASKEEYTPASPDPEELEACQAYLDSQVENIPGGGGGHGLPQVRDGAFNDSI